MQMRTIRPPPPVPFPLLLEMKNFILRDSFAFARVVNFIFLEFCGKLKILFFWNFAAVKQFLRQGNADDFAAVGGKVQVAVRACADMAKSFV